MYVYYFNLKDGKINMTSAEIIAMGGIWSSSFYSKRREFTLVRIDRKLSKWCGYEPHKRDKDVIEVRVSAEEGHIYQNKFWLSERDDDKALEIVKNRLRERLEKAKKLETYL